MPGKSHGQRGLVGYSLGLTRSWIRLSDFTFFTKVKKGTEKASDINIRRGTESAPLASVMKALYTFTRLTPITIHLKLTRLELTIERSYQTDSHNIHFNITRLVRRFLLRRNMSSNRIHYYYIIINTELKEKHTLEQDEFCCVIISSGLKKISD